MKKEGRRAFLRWLKTVLLVGGAGKLLALGVHDEGKGEGVGERGGERKRTVGQGGCWWTLTAGETVHYPGPLKRLNEREVRQVARWGG